MASVPTMCYSPSPHHTVFPQKHRNIVQIHENFVTNNGRQHSFHELEELSKHGIMLRQNRLQSWKWGKTEQTNGSRWCWSDGHNACNTAKSDPKDPSTSSKTRISTANWPGCHSIADESLAALPRTLRSAPNPAGPNLQHSHALRRTSRDLEQQAERKFQKSGVFYTESSCKAVNNRLMSVASVPLVTTCQSKSIITLESCRISLSCLKEIIWSI